MSIAMEAKFLDDNKLKTSLKKWTCIVVKVSGVKSETTVFECR